MAFKKHDCHFLLYDLFLLLINCCLISKIIYAWFYYWNNTDYILKRLIISPTFPSIPPFLKYKTVLGSCVSLNNYFCSHVNIFKFIYLHAEFFSFLLIGSLLCNLFYSFNILHYAFSLYIYLYIYISIHQMYVY